jgi:hypothetical protein
MLPFSEEEAVQTKCTYMDLLQALNHRLSSKMSCGYIHKVWNMSCDHYLKHTQIFISGYFIGKQQPLGQYSSLAD